MVGVKERVIIDWLALVSFILVAITGIMLIFYPHEGVHRGWYAIDAMRLPISRANILQIHIWSGIAFVIICGIHIATNWNCLKNLTKAAVKK